MIHEYIHPIINYLHTHPHWGWIIAYLIAFIESIAVIGTVVPGSVTMTAIGALIGAGVLPAFSTFAWAVAGAYSGDCLSYWIGLHYNERLRRMWPFKKYPLLLAKGEEFFKAHGGKSILIGRFTGPVRSVVPLIAGLLLMRPARFLPIGFISAILWAIIYMFPGIILGALSLELPPTAASKFILMCLILIAVIWAATWLTKYFFDQMWNQIDRSLIKLWDYLNTHKSSHWITTLLRNPKHKEDHQQLVRAVFFLIFSLLFLLILINVSTKGFLTYWNESTYLFLQSLRNKPIDNLLITMSLLGEKYVLFIISGIVLIYLSWKRRWWAAIHLFVITLLGAASIQAFKLLLYSPRPPIIIISDSTSSFPSGHTILSICVLGFLAVLIADNLRVGSKKYVYYSVSIIVALIAFSRLYLGAHWLTDIFASLFLGLALALLITLSYRRKNIAPIPPITLITIVVGVIILAWTGYAYVHFKSTQQEFTVSWPTQNLKYEYWWRRQLPSEVPFYRLNRIGHPSQPLNIQWLGYLNDIEQTLVQKGWQSRPAQIDLNDTVNRFVSTKHQRHLPILPMLYHNRVPKLLLVKDLGPDKPVVMLRLWQSDILINNGEIPLWLGTINYYQPPIKLITLPPKKSTQFISALSALIPDLSPFKWKELEITVDHQPPEISAINWDGKVLLVRPK